MYQGERTFDKYVFAECREYITIIILLIIFLIYYTRRKCDHSQETALQQLTKIIIILRERIKDFEVRKQKNPVISNTGVKHRKRPKYLAILLSVATNKLNSRTDIKDETFQLADNYQETLIQDITSEEAHSRLDQISLIIRCLYLHNRISDKFYFSICDIIEK